VNAVDAVSAARTVKVTLEPVIGKKHRARANLRVIARSAVSFITT